MAYQADKVGNVTREQRSATAWSYAFPTMQIDVDMSVGNGSITFYPPDAPKRVVRFDDISAVFGTTDAKGYVDYLATNTYFGEAVTIDTGGLATSALQEAGNAWLELIGNDGATASNQAAGNAYLETVAGAVVVDGGHNSMQVAIDPDYLSLNGQISVASTNTRLSLKQTHDNLPLFYSRVSAGTGAQNYNSTTCLTAMTVTSGAVGTDYAIAQSFMRPNYTAGMTHCGEFTMSNFQNETDVIKRVGLFNGGVASPYDTKDGVYLESNGLDGIYEACFANNGTIDKVAIVNTLTEYGFTVDWSKQQALMIRFLYLGGTTIQFKLVIGRQLYTIAEIQLSNVITTPFILRPNQPVRYEIRSAGGAGTFNQVCATIFTMGDSEVEGITRGILHPGAINYASAGTEYALMAFRKKSTHISVEVKLTELDIAVGTAETFQYRLLLNPTITNAPAYTAETNSAVEYFIGAANTTVTGGTCLHVGTATELANNNTFFPSNISIGHSIAGASDVFVVSIIPRTGGITPNASCGWIEGI